MKSAKWCWSRYIFFKGLIRHTSYSPILGILRIRQDKTRENTNRDLKKTTFKHLYGNFTNKTSRIPGKYLLGDLWALGVVLGFSFWFPNDTMNISLLSTYYVLSTKSSTHY